MPSSNPMTLLLCCKFRWRPSDTSTPATQDVALQPIPALDLPAEQQQQQEPEPSHQHSVIGLSDTAWAIPKDNSSLESGSAIHQPVNDDSDTGHDQSQAARKSNTAFGVVCNKLIRSIPHNANHDQPSLSSLGNSEEEISRRAELKRIMRQRIQNELESDEPDNDVENKPTHSIRCIASVVNLALPSAGPRDTIEFVVKRSSSLHAQATRIETGQLGQNVPRDLQTPQPTEEITTTPERVSPGVLDRKNELHGDADGLAPSATHLSPHLSVTEGLELAHSQKYFQLSNSANPLDRILGPDSSFNSRHASSGDSHSALGVWLIAQGLRSRDNSTLFFDDDDDDDDDEEEEDETEAPGDAEQTKRHTDSLDREKAAPPSQLYEPSGNREMLVSYEPAIVGSASEKMELKSCSHSSSRKGHQEAPIPSGEPSWGPAVTALFNSSTDNTSSDYPSKFQPSPARSQQNLYKLDPRDLDSMELSPFRWRSQASSQDQGNVDDQQFKPFSMSISQPRSISYGNIRTAQNPTQVAHDAASLIQSESASFLQREAEFRTIERRFSEALTYKKPEKKLHTHFREEFARSAPQPLDRRSFRSKIRLTIPSDFRSKSQSSDDRQNATIASVSRAQNSLLDALDKTKSHEREASDRSKRHSNLSIRPYMNRLPSEDYRKPSLERQESATDLWQRAIRLEAERRHSSSNYLSTPNANQRSPSSNRSLNGTAGAPNSASGVSDMRREVSQLTPTTDELCSPSNSKWLIERWVTQMRPKITDAAEHAGSRISTRMVNPPRSWSRFPSHNREERNKNAAARDMVYPRDFAVKRVTSEGQIRWATDMIPNGGKQRAGTMPRSFSTKFGELVKSKMSKMIPSKRMRQGQSQLPIAEHVVSSSTRMEYPEMGIHPSGSGYTELQVLSREISNMKGENHMQTPEGGLSKPQSSQSLGDRVVALMHEATRLRHSKHDDTHQSTEYPVVPLTPSLVRESTAATDVFVTPKSRFSDDAADGERKNGPEAHSTKMEGHETQSTLSETDGASSQPKSSTLTGVRLEETTSATTLWPTDEIPGRLHAI
ncbi:hypothetical protein FSARC_4903 [Fusarium sarcochroum]|uniref:Uncharacterized protein n=1 Tax=Fusarium sarcochroum TaxID=1208366 RepID=A0A8H4XA20_9HYPO|nr:hypothetical protein FSARC_4903 [Fusarium sarcochroum]